MNRADGVAEFVGCDQHFDLLVVWIGPSPPRGPGGAVVRLVVADHWKHGRWRRRRSDGSFARLDRGGELGLFWWR